MIGIVQYICNILDNSDKENIYGVQEYKNFCANFEGWFYQQKILRRWGFAQLLWKYCEHTNTIIKVAAEEYAQNDKKSYKFDCYFKRNCIRKGTSEEGQCPFEILVSAELASNDIRIECIHLVHNHEIMDNDAYAELLSQNVGIIKSFLFQAIRQEDRSSRCNKSSHAVDRWGDNERIDEDNERFDLKTQKRVKKSSSDSKINLASETKIIADDDNDTNQIMQTCEKIYAEDEDQNRETMRFLNSKPVEEVNCEGGFEEITNAYPTKLNAVSNSSRHQL